MLTEQYFFIENNKLKNVQFSRSTKEHEKSLSQLLFSTACTTVP